LKFPRRKINNIIFSYGFVTYDNANAVNNALEESDNLNLHGKKLNIGRAVRKQPTGIPYNTDPLMNAWMLHPGGYASMTNSAGVTYFVAPQNQMPLVSSVSSSNSSS
jgi:RNA recognition motif-containing protein